MPHTPRAALPSFGAVDVQLRETWSNHTGNQRCEPLQVLRPESLDDLVAAVATGEADHVTVRAVGSGHSWSDVALTGGLLLRPRGARRPLRSSRAAARAGPTGRRLVRVLSGTRIRELNAPLDGAGSRCRTWAATTGRRSRA